MEEVYTEIKVPSRLESFALIRGQCAEHLPEFVTRFYPLLHAMHIFRDPIPLSLNLVFTSERSTTLHFVWCTAVLEKDPVGSKVLESYVSVSNSEITAEKEQPDRELKKLTCTISSSCL